MGDISFRLMMPETFPLERSYKDSNKDVFPLPLGPLTKHYTAPAEGAQPANFRTDEY